MSDALLRAPSASSPRARRIAGGTGMGLALAVASVATGATPAQAEEYTVRQGDTVSHIALRTSTSVARIVAANALDSRASIRAGQRLVIPREGAAPAAPAPAAAPAARTHAVVPGDTVSAIAKRYGTTVAAVVKANGLDTRAFIRAGQRLTIPGGAAAPITASRSTATPAAATTTHRVVAGDTVSALAKRYGTSVRAIVEANSLNRSAMIRIGQSLTVPTAGASAAAPSAPATTLVGNTFAGRTYPEATVASANQNKATLLELGVPSRAEMQRLVATTATAMGVDPALAQAIAYQESGFNHTAVSPANAIGTMQVIPSSGRWASDLVGRDLNLLDPQDNVVAGVAILRRLVATSPDLSTAIASYYQGQAGVRKHGMYPDTRRYVANVRTHMSRFA